MTFQNLEPPTYQQHMFVFSVHSMAMKMIQLTLHQVHRSIGPLDHTECGRVYTFWGSDQLKECHVQGAIGKLRWYDMCILKECTNLHNHELYKYDIVKRGDRLMDLELLHPIFHIYDILALHQPNTHHLNSSKQTTSEQSLVPSVASSIMLKLFEEPSGCITVPLQGCGSRERDREGISLGYEWSTSVWNK